VDIGAQRDAKKARMTAKDALALLEEIDEIYAARGTRVVYLDLRRAPPDAAILRGALLGPTGNLRAPTLRKGRTLIVGFDEATYAKLLR
jgi:hypothetical protein